LQVPAPRLDPHVVGRAVQHPVHLGARLGEGEEQLEQGVAAGAGAHVPGLAGDAGAGQPVGAVFLERVGAPLVAGADEVPPGDVLVLLEPALLAAGQQHEQAPDVVAQVLGGEAEVFGEEEPESLEQVPGGGGEVGGDEQLALPLPGDLRLRGVNQVVKDRRPVVGDASHRVRDVAVEPREEAEAVLAGEVRAPVRAGVGHPQAAGLPARLGVHFVNDDLEPALGELVGGGHAGDAAAQDGDLLAHGCLGVGCEGGSRHLRGAGRR
jgi:hypothetical protein